MAGWDFPAAEQKDNTVMDPARCTPPADGLRLYVFPHAGGSSMMFHHWAARFPATWDVAAIDAPGHGTRWGEEPLTDGDALVSHLLTRLGPGLDASPKPFAFFGHSMGALIAHELTRRLLAQGRTPPLWLGLSACGAPRPGSRPATALLHEASDAELRQRLAQLGGTPPKVLEHNGLWAFFAPVIRADLRLVANWQPAPAPPLPATVAVSVFGGTHDPAAHPTDLARWATHSERYLGLRLLDGGHFYFHHSLPALTTAIMDDIHTAHQPAHPTPTP
ncbi:thioesterase II family protein [Streptomyces sp. SAS_270]|uniref:thioesterase II family protein n=1 Tax=Streptomyces sp. SAS_270 TaxID=3412748 RepID=UPI00403C3EEA